MFKQLLLLWLFLCILNSLISLVDDILNFKEGLLLLLNECMLFLFLFLDSSLLVFNDLQQGFLFLIDLDNSAFQFISLIQSLKSRNVWDCFLLILVHRLVMKTLYVWTIVLYVMAWLLSQRLSKIGFKGIFERTCQWELLTTHGFGLIARDILMETGTCMNIW